MGTPIHQATDEQLIESLKDTLKNTTLDNKQQALFQELARRAGTFTQLQSTLQQQSQQLSQYDADMKAMQAQHTQLTNDMATMQTTLQSQLQQQQNEIATLQAQAQPTQPATANTSQTTQPVVPRVKPDKPSKFSGNPRQLNNWLFQLESYYTATYLYNPYDQTNFAVTLLDDKALTWWRSCLQKSIMQQGQTTFDVFKKHLCDNFKDHDYQYTLRRKLQLLKQTKSVENYISKYRELVTDLGVDAPDDNTQFYDFLAGLKPEVHKQVLLGRPTNLTDAMMLATRTDNVLYLATRNVTKHDTRGTPMELGNVNTSKKQGKNKGSKNRGVNINQATKQGGKLIECWYCGKPGHVEKECYKKQRDVKKSAGHTPRGKNNNQFNRNKGGKGKTLYQTQCSTSDEDDHVGYASDTSTESKN